eukprot:4986549-Alexandrium_andersonii.AAC.1
MSASLVGSEMCIRDRNGFDPDLIDELRVRFGGPSAGARVVPSSAVPNACLLYTSDAADDM